MSKENTLNIGDTVKVSSIAAIKLFYKTSDKKDLPAENEMIYVANHIGIVRDIYTYFDLIGVEFNNCAGGHTLGGKIKNQNGWYVCSDLLKKIPILSQTTKQKRSRFQIIKKVVETK